MAKNILFILVTLFYLLYFYKQISLRRKGITTDRLAKGTKPNKTRTIETALFIATYSTALVQYLSIFFIQYMIPINLSPIIGTVGLLVTTIGVVFFILAITTMKDNWRAGVDIEQKTAIVETGVYKYSRNPAFVGFDLMYIGTFLTVSNTVLLLFVLATIVLLHLQILEEEAFLPTVFGSDYLEYRKSTPRYLFLNS